MTRVLKLLLLWLLALALPMQGYAAATRISCDVAQAHHVASADHKRSAHHHAQPGAETMHAHAIAGQTTHSRHHSDSESGEHKHSSCNTCAACCIGAAATPAALHWHPPHDSKERRSSFFTVSFSGHVPPGIERPPRPVLA
jgi:hypothetical protein